MNKVVETPLDDHSRSVYTSLVHKRYFIIAKLSSSIFKKQYNYFPAISNCPDEIKKALSKHLPPSMNLEISIVLLPTFLQQPFPSYVILQTVNPNVCINSSSSPTNESVTKILNLLRPHVELSPNSDLFVILNHIFDTYRILQNHLQHHNADIQTSAISTIHVNDCLGNSFSQKIVSNFSEKNIAFKTSLFSIF